VAVIVTVPACKIVTMEPDTGAMLGFELVYEKATGLVEVGAVMVNVPPE
jgi:hypothetical protein